MPLAPRRSGRARKANTKYTDDGWDKDTLRLLRESTRSSSPKSVDPEEDAEIRTQSDVEVNTHDEAEVSVDEDGFSAQSGSEKSSSVATPENDLNDDQLHVNLENISTVPRRSGQQATQPHSRGVAPVERGRSVKGGVWQSVFGPELEDLKPMLQAKDRWLFNARDVTLPSRRSIQEARDHEWNHYNQRDNALEHSTHGPLRLDDRQKLNQISVEEARSRLFLVSQSDHDIVIGPWKEQQKFNMPFLNPINLDQAWKIEPDAPNSAAYHSGWLINVGERPSIHGMGTTSKWSSISGHSLSVYSQATEFGCKTRSYVSPAFSPSASYPMSVQIWKFSIKDNDKNESTIDTQILPQLVQLLGCNTGDVKQLAWSSSQIPDTADNDTNSLGLLTVITTDGYARLIHVPQPDPTSSTTTYYELQEPLLKITPPQGGIFTCFTHASPTDLILGLSSGHIHAYNVNLSTAQTDAMIPYFTHQLYHTYVLALTAISSDYPTPFLASTSAVGTLKLTDLRSPDQDHLSLPRARLPTRNLLASAHTHAIITSIDNSGNTEARGNAQTTVVAHQFRHFYTSLTLSRFPEGQGLCTSLAGSPLHPHILIGHSSGTVWSQNTTRRILPTGKSGTSTDGGAWVQKLVEYEWTRHPSLPSPTHPAPPHSVDPDIDPSLTTPNSTTYVPDLYHGSPTRQGLSRMHHGFRLEKLDLSNTGSRKRKAAASGPNGEGAIQVIFEEENAVTAMCWNVNPVAAGWAGIGWGAGVVWVGDLAGDAE